MEIFVGNVSGLAGGVNKERPSLWNNPNTAAPATSPLLIGMLMLARRGPWVYRYLFFSIVRNMAIF